MLKRIATVCSTLLVLSGCDAMMPARSASGWGQDTRAEVESTLQEATKMPPVRAVQQPPAAAAPAAAPVSKEARFDLNSEETPAQAFFMALVDQTEHNIVVHPEVSGSISLMLQDVTVEEVLDVVSEVYATTTVAARRVTSFFRPRCKVAYFRSTTSICSAPAFPAPASARARSASRDRTVGETTAPETVLSTSRWLGTRTIRRKSAVPVSKPTMRPISGPNCRARSSR